MQRILRLLIHTLVAALMVTSLAVSVGARECPAGPQGPQGKEGPQGMAGEPGAQGPQGKEGPQGPQGKEGAQGPQGKEGPQGSQGKEGDQGPQGKEGDQGPQGAAGGGGIVTGSTVGKVANNVTTFVGPYRTFGPGETTEANAEIKLTGPATYKSLKAEVETGPAATRSWTVTLRKNGADTALACTIVNPNRTCTDTDAGVAYAAGDTIDVKVTATNAPAARELSWVAAE